MKLTKEDIDIEVLNNMIQQLEHLKKQLKSREEELLEEAKKRFPIGTKIRLFEDNKEYFRTVNSIPYISTDSIRVETPIEEWEKDYFPSNPAIYENGEWAEIIEQPKETRKEYTLVDGSKVYEGDRVWFFGYHDKHTHGQSVENFEYLNGDSHTSQLYKSKEDCEKALQKYLENQSSISWNQIQEILNDWLESKNTMTLYNSILTLKPKINE